MRNLDLLTLSNFHLADPTAVTQLRLEGSILFDKKTFIETLTNLNIIRLNDIDWTLNTNTLLDRLLNIMGMDELGYTVAQSYLAGTVSLTGTVYEGKYNEYIAAWSPDLTIDLSQASFVSQHLVTYKNYDGTKLYECYINHGSPIIDPYSNNLLDFIPSRAANVQYSYVFGTLDNTNTYIPYSGWRISTDASSIYDTYGENPNVPVNGAIEVIAMYSTVT